MGGHQDIDALIAIKVMGWKKKKGVWYDSNLSRIPLGQYKFSSNIEHAFLVVKMMKVLKFNCNIKVDFMSDKYMCIFSNKGGSEVWAERHKEVAMAICIAALKVVWPKE